MMISPEAYIAHLEGASYNELIKERDRLIRSIRKYEKLEKAGDRSSEDWFRCPSPDVVYQCSLEYLAKLCLFMQERYNEDYVCGDKRLSDKG